MITALWMCSSANETWNFGKTLPFCTMVWNLLHFYEVEKYLNLLWWTNSAPHECHYEITEIIMISMFHIFLLSRTYFNFFFYGNNSFFELICFILITFDMLDEQFFLICRFCQISKCFLWPICTRAFFELRFDYNFFR